MHDVVIIGGGPAGSTAATLLAQRGIDVLLLERELFPREHIGESLLPATLAVLEQIGVLPEVQAAGFTVKRGATMLWGTMREPWSWYFAETNQRFPHSFQVWRPTFDALLLNHAQRCGAQVRCGRGVREVLFANYSANDSNTASDNNSTQGQRARGVRLTDGTTIEARIVLDASGQRALLARQRGLIEFDTFFRNLAVYGYFAGGEKLPAPDDGNIFIESYAEGWSWNIPLNRGGEFGNWSSVGFVMDRDRALSQLQCLGVNEMYRQQLQLTTQTKRMLAKANVVRAPTVLQDWSYRSREFAGNGWILAGDAACFIDPLFSTGVHLAVTAGLLSAALATSMLTDAQLGVAASATYTQVYGRQYEHFHRLAQLFYSGNRTIDSYFWEARRLMGDVDAATSFGARESFVRAVSGRAPAGYERSVLAHGDLPAAFVAAIDTVQFDRAERRAEMNARRATLTSLRPLRAEGVSIEQRAVLGAGQFEWGEVIVATERDDPVPCSALVSALIAGADGTRSLQQIAMEITSGANGEHEVRAKVLAGLCNAAEVLFVDGLLAQLR